MRPLALAFWGGVWTIAAWCESRNDFRVFRVDRMKHHIFEDVVFTLRPRQRLAYFLKQHARKQQQFSH